MIHAGKFLFWKYNLVDRETIHIQQKLGLIQSAESCTGTAAHLMHGSRKRMQRLDATTATKAQYTNSGRKPRCSADHAREGVILSTYVWMAVGFCISSDAQSVISVQKQNTREKNYPTLTHQTSRNIQHTHTAPLVSSLKITIPIQCSDVDSASLRLPHHVVAETNWIYPASAMGTGQSIASIIHQFILYNLISLCQLVINQTHFQVGNPLSIIAWCIY